MIDDYDIYEVNLSDHSPLLLNINFAPYGLHNINMSFGSSRSCLRAAWNKATDDNIANYQAELSHIVDKILCNIPADYLHCTNTTCRLHDHLSVINACASDLKQAMLKAAGHCIPLVGMQANGNPSCVVGWNDECKRLKGQSLFWHKLWVDTMPSKSYDLEGIG